MHLRDFDSAGFLRDYWQKRPLLIKNPWVSWINPLEPDELAGLACEDGVEARLVQHSDTSAQGEWTVEHGPIAEARFATLGERNWTLLVQAVDHLVPDVAALIQPFRFIPDWRIDDVMVSYASDGGGVGPHFDQYDVFLIQGLGKRRWQTGAVCDSGADLVPHDDLRLLANFEALEEWLLEPGDILYLPPGVSHNGTAVGDDCMTYSIGFRAPGHSELIAHYCDDMLEHLQEDSRYADPDLQTQANAGEISQSALTRLHETITERVLDRDAFARWFGQFISTPKYPEIDWRPEEPIDADSLRRALTAQGKLSRNPASRFSFIRQSETGLLLFVDGHCFGCTGDVMPWVEALCAQDRMGIDAALPDSDAAMELLVTLFNQGSLAFEPED